MNVDDYIGRGEVASILGMTESVVSQWTKSGELEPVKIFGRLAWRRDDVVVLARRYWSDKLRRWEYDRDRLDKAIAMATERLSPIGGPMTDDELDFE